MKNGKKFYTLRPDCNETNLKPVISVTQTSWNFENLDVAKCGCFTF